ncbi:hypothetical protein TNCT_557991 [Trichonephila clavata]|uniref:Uncharacterized protein n=1 Tax=Trichonephila clavata TaxID=2740835 RepID=A0A8X6JAJ9_TRICU|nr:hypothetical protein TNCT_557991 [Trichonephila clavata]
MELLGQSSTKICLLCFLMLSFSAVCESTFHHLMMIIMKPKPDTCQPNCCKAVMCPMPKCHPHQVMKPKAGWCGCCPKCMTQLKMGMPCKAKPKHPCPKMPSSECGHGLKCKHGKCCR